MEIILSDSEIINEIKAYPCPNWIWIKIWDTADYEIQIVVTISNNGLPKLGEHKTIRVCSASTNEDDDEVENLKKYGKRIVRLLRRKFPNSEVHSDLYYS